LAVSVGPQGLNGIVVHIRPDDLLGRMMSWACEQVEVPLNRIEEIAARHINIEAHAPVALAILHNLEEIDGC
jgi:hypothetical protein